MWKPHLLSTQKLMPMRKNPAQAMNAPRPWAVMMAYQRLPSSEMNSAWPSLSKRPSTPATPRKAVAVQIQRSTRRRVRASTSASGGVAA